MGVGCGSDVSQDERSSTRRVRSSGALRKARCRGWEVGWLTEENEVSWSWTVVRTCDSAGDEVWLTRLQCPDGVGLGIERVLTP